jgi:hypothetical protein
MAMALTCALVPAPHHHIFAHRQSDALLMLVAQIGQMRIEEVAKDVLGEALAKRYVTHAHIEKIQR